MPLDGLSLVGFMGQSFALKYLQTSCIPPDDYFQLRQQPCKHIESVRLLLDRQIKGEPPPVRRHRPSGRSLASLLHFPTPAP
jgi:hypothetical protein